MIGLYRLYELFMSFVINSNSYFILFLIAYPLIVVKPIRDNVWNNFLKQMFVIIHHFCSIGSGWQKPLQRCGKSALYYCVQEVGHS